ncbi:MAG: hypothetical protein YHS30scaffold667_44 [Phage 65_10]|nr:MAG: hypothetical protein YHS30scaffold667_44 [Phage 65_10]
MALVRTIRNNLQVGNLILQVPMHKDLAPQFRDFANRVLRRDPAALLHLNLAAPPASEPVIHVDAESGRAYELVEGEWVRYRGTV